MAWSGVIRLYDHNIFNPPCAKLFIESINTMAISSLYL